MAASRTREPVRRLSAEQLGLGTDPADASLAADGSNRPDDPPLDSDDPLLEEVRELLPAYGGIIFTGPPGTSKSWYAAKIAAALTDGDVDRVRLIQFHPSYQYEDFVQGYVPDRKGGGFRLQSKHLLDMAEAATKAPSKLFVLVIDELSRGDPGRIFGEALTYIEKTKRGLPFQLSSGDTCVIPDNLVFLATMNPLDRGVDEVDMAFERRFAKIPMDPSDEILEGFLAANGMADPLRGRVIGFFRKANGMARTNPFGSLGHTYFRDVHDEASLRRLWRHQLRFLFQKAYQLDPDGLRELEEGWQRATAEAQLGGTTTADASGAEAPEGASPGGPAPADESGSPGNETPEQA